MSPRFLVLATLAALGLPALADGAPDTQPERKYILSFTGATPIQVLDIDSILPGSLVKGRSRSMDCGASSHRPALTSHGSYSRPWKGETTVPDVFANHTVFSAVDLAWKAADGTAIPIQTLQNPSLTEWVLEAENGISATETVKFTYQGRREDR